MLTLTLTLPDAGIACTNTIATHAHADVLIHSYDAQCTWTALEIGNRISLNLKYFNSIILF